MPDSYSDFFTRVAGSAPHAWQADLASSPDFGSRLIRIPTGFGKTFGVLLAWAYHRVVNNDDRWPRRLVWCLPMRVLVEQTQAEASRVLDALGVRWDHTGDHQDKVGVHLLMGGANAGEWHLWPEHAAVLIGTQDMLLSRALNRGYAASRARWPMDFGLLNTDCLWVMDEVQLMDVGLATSAQLQAFRRPRAGSRPAATWWMSATLQPAWLRSRDTAAFVDGLPHTRIPADARRGHLWDDVRKPLEVLTEPKQLAAAIGQWHADAGSGAEGPTVVVVNTVKRAVKLTQELRKTAKGVSIRLVHSRFRPRERAGWREEFLNRAACAPGTNRIIVATQVIEAGVDLSAALLVTDLAPWTSLVQRFGRAARWGGTARVVVLDTEPKDDKAAAPYDVEALDAARSALGKVSDVSPASLEAFEEGLDRDALAMLYPYAPASLLLEHEVGELFDTTADLTGADIDVSRFIRTGEERDLQVFWAAVPDAAAPTERPTREALCPVPFLAAREWLFGKGRGLKRPRSAWVWDWLEGAWRVAEPRDLFPGQTVLVDATVGGYHWRPSEGWGLGFSAESTEPVDIVAAQQLTVGERADGMLDDDSVSEASRYRTIATHGAETGAIARSLGEALGSRFTELLEIAGLWHDVGKAHAAFQGSIRGDDRPARTDLAKAPPQAWSWAWLYQTPDGGKRRGFRHELASALRLFAVLQQHRPEHPGLLGPWLELLSAMGESPEPSSSASTAAGACERQILALTGEQFDLLVYLVASHHGKVRLSLHTTPADQDAMASSGALTIRGLRDRDVLPATALGPRGDGGVPSASLDLSPSSMGISPRSGASWTDRALGIVRALGPFELAWLEALLRAADQRASQLTTPDPLLTEDEEAV
jgi:CRISPR-associated endonuclease/helicase Cas3